jgi:hypothetical protein
MSPTADSSAALRNDKQEGECNGKNNRYAHEGFYFYVDTLVQEREYAGERDAHPHGTVVEFVEEFVERFFQQIRCEA